MYLLLNEGLARARERCQAEPTANAYLTELLTMSAGTVGGVTHYRPFWVAARYLSQNPDIRDLSRAEGEAVFTLAQPRIDDLMAQQAAYDSAFNLTIPPGMGVPLPSGSGGISRPIVPVAGTQSVRTTSVI